MDRRRNIGSPNGNRYHIYLSRRRCIFNRPPRFPAKRTPLIKLLMSLRDSSLSALSRALSLLLPPSLSFLYYSDLRDCDENTRNTPKRARLYLLTPLCVPFLLPRTGRSFPVRMQLSIESVIFSNDNRSSLFLSIPSSSKSFEFIPVLIKFTLNRAA